MTVQETSRAVYYGEIIPTLGHRQQKVYDALRMQPNMTNLEISELMKWPINTVTPRVNELVKAGLVIEDCKRFCSVSGRKSIAWAAKKATLF